MSHEDQEISAFLYQDDFNPQEKIPMSDNFVKAGIPFLTNYRSLFGRNSPFWYVKDDIFPGIHFNHIKLSFPIAMCHLLLLLSYLIWKTQVYDYYFDELNFYFYFITVIYIAMVISMCRTILMNPGYLPFFYPAQTDRKKFTQAEYRQGYACTKDQFDWAKKQPRPHRSCFSEYAGYYVVRGDHHCMWVSNWIGYRNHRFFVIFVTLSAIYLDTIFLHVVHMFFMHRKVHSFLCFAFMIGNSAFFGFVFSAQVFRQYIDLTYNLTINDLIKGRTNFYDRGCLNNWSEVCGSKKLICLWPFPCFYLKPAYNPFEYPEYIGPSKNDRGFQKDLVDIKEDQTENNIININTPDDNLALL